MSAHHRWAADHQKIADWVAALKLHHLLAAHDPVEPVEWATRERVLAGLGPWLTGPPTVPRHAISPWRGPGSITIRGRS